MVKLLHVAQRDIHVSHLVLDVFQAREFLVQLGGDRPVTSLWSISRRSEYQR